ncbi:MAG: T9SS type A sorting domain-containing protein, partial [Ignavibacteria bacterium]
ITSVDDKDLTAKGYYLSQNYPNPFNPLTNIDFQMAEDGYVKISIYNLMGQKIKDIINDFRKAGSYSIMLNALELPSGIYFYTMTANNFSQTRKLILLK